MSFDRDREADSLTQNDTYELIVVFRRSLSADIDVIRNDRRKGRTPLPEALTQQFITELQAAYDELGVAGSFQVIAGPSVSLRR